MLITCYCFYIVFIMLPIVFISVYSNYYSANYCRENLKCTCSVLYCIMVYFIVYHVTVVVYTIVLAMYIWSFLYCTCNV